MPTKTTTVTDLQLAILKPSRITDEWIDELEVNQAVIDELKKQIAPSLFDELYDLLDAKKTEYEDLLDDDEFVAYNVTSKDYPGGWNTPPGCVFTEYEYSDRYEEVEMRVEKLEKILSYFEKYYV